MSIYYYHQNYVDFLKIYTQLPAFVPKLRSLLPNFIHSPSSPLPPSIYYLSIIPSTAALETGVTILGYGSKAFQTYEANIDFVLRHLFDMKADGCCWLELPAGAYTLRDSRSDHPVTSTVQYEADIACVDSPSVHFIFLLIN